MFAFQLLSYASEAFSCQTSSLILLDRGCPEYSKLPSSLACLLPAWVTSASCPGQRISGSSFASPFLALTTAWAWWFACSLATLCLIASWPCDLNARHCFGRTLCWFSQVSFVFYRELSPVDLDLYAKHTYSAWIKRSIEIWLFGRAFLRDMTIWVLTFGRHNLFFHWSFLHFYEKALLTGSSFSFFEIGRPESLGKYLCRRRRFWTFGLLRMTLKSGRCPVCCSARNYCCLFA